LLIIAKLEKVINISITKNNAQTAKIAVKKKKVTNAINNKQLLMQHDWH
jgi:hypothetical protein